MQLNLQGYPIVIPDPPKDKELIYGWDKTKSEQYWQRPYTLSDEQYDNLSPAQQAEIRRTETIRRTEGFWFMNNGKPLYLTGDAYFYFTHWKIDGDYPLFIINQVEDYYFDYFCESDPYCFGSVRMKPRREGCTQRRLASFVNQGTLDFNAHYGIQSKTAEDAETVNFDNLVKGFFAIPKWMQPELQNTSLPPHKEIIFGKRRGGTKNQGVSLNTKIDWAGTVANAYDGKKLKKFLGDECFAKGTKILCEGLVFRNIEDINIGDKVIVEGGKLMEVGATCRGNDEMFIIKQPHSKDYVVNSQHRLYLEQRCKSDSRIDDGIKIITPQQFLLLDNYRKRTTFGVRSNGIKCDYQFVPLDPYIFGIWMGDGKSQSPTICVNPIDKKEVYTYIKEYADIYGYDISEEKTQSDKCIRVRLKIKNNSNNTENPFSAILRKLNVWGNKFIPDCYINNIDEVRLQLLAGLLDTDGVLVRTNNSYKYEISQCREGVSESIALLCRALGFKVTLKEWKTNFNTKSYRVTISGDGLFKIPCKVVRKQVPKDYKRQYADHINKISIQSIGQGEYYGITLKADNDNDRRLILEDFTLSMNCFKWEVSPFDKTWDIVKYSLQNKGVIYGKAYLLSTVGEVSEKTVDIAREIWRKSNYEKRVKGTRQTETGVYRWFIPDWAAYFGLVLNDKCEIDYEKGKPVLDKYGNIDFSKVRKYLKMQLDSIKDNIGKRNFIRKNPPTAEDALNYGSSGTVFDTFRLSERTKYLDDYQPTKDRPVRYREGDLYWIDKRFGKVGFRDKENGKWKISYLPDVAGVEKVNRIFTTDKGFLRPYSDTPFRIGVDPFSYSNRDGEEFSKGAFHVKLMSNVMRPELSNIYCLEYCYREKVAEMFYEDVALTMFYFGAKVNTERSPASGGLETYMEKNGLNGFMMKRPDITKNSKWKERDSWIGTPATEDTIEMGIRYIENYIAEPNPLINENKIDNLKTFWFSDTLKQLMDYTIKNKTKFDLVASMIQTEIACQPDKRIKEAAADHVDTRKKLFEYVFGYQKSDQQPLIRQLQ